MTLVNRITFRDIITVIKTHGFTNNPYPIILSLEDHCDIENQRNMSRLLHEILKE